MKVHLDAGEFQNFFFFPMVGNFSQKSIFIPLLGGLTNHIKIDPWGNKAFKSSICSQSFYTVTQDEVKNLYLNMN